MLAPIFVKANLKFAIDSKTFEFLQQNVSTFGVTGLSWQGLSPSEHFGRTVSCTVRLLVPDPVTLLTRAFILREQSVYSGHMGLKFVLTPDQKDLFSQIVRRHGIYPTDYVRKYPRIPAMEEIQTFPLRVMARPATDDASADPIPISFDIENLSPNGVLISTENQNSLSFEPGHRLDMIIDPRGWFPVPVEVQGLICRVMDDISTSSGNIRRYLGVKFAKVDEVNRAAFLDLLKDVLAKVKEKKK